MNNSRRLKLSALQGKLVEIKEYIEEIKTDEEMAFDNMPENLQGSQKGEESEEAIDYMDQAIDSIEEAIDSIDSII